MSPLSIQHDFSTGSVELLTRQCKILCLRPILGTIVIQISGKDSGALYRALFNELEPDLVSNAPVRLFIDTRQASGYAINIVDWGHFVGEDHGLFGQIHVLVGSTLVGLSAKIIKHLSRTGELIQIHTMPATYHFELQQAVSIRQAA